MENVMIKKHASLAATLLMAIAPAGGPIQDSPEGPAAPPQTTVTEIPLVPAPARKPFTNLIFVSPRTQLNVPQPTVVAAEPQRDVVCGMRLMPANPAVDRKMLVQPRLPKPNTDYKIRSLTPTVCRQ
jgi:hypothetical protein